MAFHLQPAFLGDFRFCFDQTLIDTMQTHWTNKIRTWKSTWRTVRLSIRLADCLSAAGPKWKFIFIASINNLIQLSFEMFVAHRPNGTKTITKPQKECNCREHKMCLIIRNGIFTSHQLKQMPIQKMCINLKTGLCRQQNFAIGHYGKLVGNVGQKRRGEALWTWLVPQSWPAKRFPRQTRKLQASWKRNTLQKIQSVI